MIAEEIWDTPSYRISSNRELADSWPIRDCAQIDLEQWWNPLVHAVYGQLTRPAP